MKKQPLYIGGQDVMTEKTVPVYNKELKLRTRKTSRMP